MEREWFEKLVANDRFCSSSPKHLQMRRRTSAHAHLRIGMCVGECLRKFRSDSLDV